MELAWQAREWAHGVGHALADALGMDYGVLAQAASTLDIMAMLAAAFMLLYHSISKNLAAGRHDAKEGARHQNRAGAYLAVIIAGLLLYALMSGSLPFMKRILFWK